jgi:hypothetical protein
MALVGKESVRRTACLAGVPAAKVLRVWRKIEKPPPSRGLIL